MAKQKFGIHPAGYVFLALVFVAYIVLGVMNGGMPADPEAFGRRIGIILGGIIGAMTMAVIFSRIAYYACGRSMKAATTGFMAGAGLIFAAHTVIFLTNTAEAVQAKNIDRAASNIKAARESMINEIETQGYATTSSLSVGVREMEKLAETANATDAPVYRTLAEHFAAIDKASQNRDAAVEAAVAAGMYDISKFRSATDIENCGRAVVTSREATLQVHSIQKNIPGELQQRLAAKGLASQMGHPAVTSVILTSRQVTPIALAAIECDLKSHDATLARLRLLRDNWGKWQATPEGGILVGDGFGEAALNKYNRLIQVEEEMAAKQQEYVQRLARLN